MNDQIVQIFKIIFPNSCKSITDLLKKLIPVFEKKFRNGPRRGKKMKFLKNVLAAVFYRIKTGCSWRQIPGFFGNWRTIYGWYRKFTLCDFFEILYEKLIVALQREKPNLFTIQRTSANLFTQLVGRP